jgi:hypothetical protein
MRYGAAGTSAGRGSQRAEHHRVVGERGARAKADVLVHY